MSQSKNTVAINIKDVSYRYPKGQSHVCVPDWEVKQGERIFLYGPSGSGKTTLLNLLAGILTPDQGSISLLQQPFSSLSERKRDKFRARHIGVVFQQFNLITHLTVMQNIELAAHFGSGSQPKNDDIAGIIAALQLPQTVLSSKANQLSVGQQQRVAIARALINHPEILLVDEPTSALDTDARDAFMQLLIKLCEQFSTTLLFVSHDQSLSTYLDKRVAVNEIFVAGETYEC